jgi:hypothetical protein
MTKKMTHAVLALLKSLKEQVPTLCAAMKQCGVHHPSMELAELRFDEIIALLSEDIEENEFIKGTFVDCFMSQESPFTTDNCLLRRLLQGPDNLYINHRGEVRPMPETTS